ncbi:AAA family ATPase [Bordetella bronchialis]|uniref:Restriction endonuclease n=1 Tax=Bordetella bronchialis TaxID=463025 RepID=A0ABN4R018_9BORD|nr:AAA family ATPase [Bordetella bronchialis]ANN66629.1 restriction endonuclease [Bordetella bronchialis]
MSQVHEEIKAWLLTQPEWLQEAADRLLNQGRLHDEDIAAVAALLKTDKGQSVTKHRAYASLIKTPAIPGELRLISISNVQGIENLSPKAALDFGSGNLVVVYGHNGSGKSGYTRILKRAGGKPRAAPLKANVFGDAPAVRQCKLEFKDGQITMASVWNADDQALDALRAIDIFDSDEAQHYLTKESSAVYVPPLVFMFEQLAAACDSVKGALQTEQAKLVSGLPAMPAEFAATEPARHYAALQPNMTAADVDQLTAWTQEHAQQLHDLTERLKVADPAAVATQRRARKAQVQQIAFALSKGEAALGEAGVQAIRALQTAAKEKRLVATEAARVKSAILDGVGQPTWHAMWRAAREYSQLAYPERRFPVTDNARCLLCHQELHPDAQQRLQDFEAFVGSKLEEEAKAAEETHRKAVAALPVVPTEEQLMTQCAAAALEEPEWLESLKAFWHAARLASEALVVREVNGPAFPAPAVTDLVARLEVRAQALEAEAMQLDKDAKLFDRAKAAKDKLALEAQLWVYQQKVAVITEVERRKAWNDFETWKGLASPRRVSMKASEVAEKVITESYVDRFNAELEALGAKRVRVAIVKTRTDKGRALHQVKLTGVKGGQEEPAGILSEGERRIISLAAFLADVTGKPNIAPFVFDDPISSLDQDFEWTVARRLAELAKTRQVLVFTHRLSLYGALEDTARKNGDKWRESNLVQRCIETFLGAAGHPVAQAVWNSKTDAASNSLLERLREAKKAGEAGGSHVYKAHAQGICTDFRKLLERTVEDDLLNTIVKRHRRSVTTDGKLKALSAITAPDCVYLDTLMTKYSCYEHSQSTETPAFIPDEPELKADIETLVQWRTDFLARRKAALG